MQWLCCGCAVAVLCCAVLCCTCVENIGLTSFPPLPPPRRQAAASTARWEAGKQLGVFDGVPVAVKEMIRVAGHPVHNGFDPTSFPPLQGGFPSYGTPCLSDDPIVTRFRDAGAIIVGMTSMTEGGVTPLGVLIGY